MKKRISQSLYTVAIMTVILFSCANPPNPFTNTVNVKISLAFKDSRDKAGADLAVSDTVGNTVKIGVCPYLSDLIDSVAVTIIKYRNNTDSVYVLTSFSSDIDTQWNSFTFTTIGTWTVSAKAFVRGGTLYGISGGITIYGKIVSATIQPTTETRVVDSIATFSVSAIGDAPFSYQWYHDAATMTGETGVSFIKSHIAFSDSGIYTCLVRDKWGDSSFSDTAILIVTPKVVIVANIKPLISVSGHPTILSTEICSLKVTATDPDSGQTHVCAAAKGPAGYTFSGNLFIWAPPTGYLGTDTVKTDTAIFTVTDDGQPPLSDTQKVPIVVKAKIFPPDSIKGMGAVSRISGNFTFKWNMSKNADQYVVYRSRDTTGFILFATTQDTFFTNAIKDTAFYYYVVATNSKGQSSPSILVRSTAINTAPKWSHDTISVSINEGVSFSMNCADSCKDTNADAVSFSLIFGGPGTDSLVTTTWKYKPSFTDSGSYTVKIKAWDGSDSSILTMNLHVVNVQQPPQPLPQNLSTNRNTAMTITLSATVPGGGDPVNSWLIDTQTTHGTSALSISAGAGTVTYTPVADYIGTDYFTFKAISGSLSSAFSAKVTIRIDTNNIAPKISTKLSAKALNKGDSLILTVAINQDAFPAPRYYWHKDRTLLDSSQVNTWKKANIQGTDSGFYYVIVLNPAGRDSSGAHVTVNVPVSITTEPVTPPAKCQGDSVTFSVTAAGTPPFSYQWQRGGTALTQDTLSVLRLTSLTTANAGIYTCRVDNKCNSPATSKPCTLTVYTLSVAPTGVTASFPAICQGSADTLKVVGGTLGSGASWNWYTTSTYTAPAIGTGTKITVTPTSTIKYFVRAEGTCGNTTDVDTVTVTVNTPSVAPTGVTASSPAICQGSADTLKVVGGTLGSGAAWNWYTTSTYTAPAIGTGAKITVTPTSTTKYYVRAEGTCGNTTAIDTVTVTVHTASTAPTSITVNPNTTTVCPSTTLLLTPSGGSLGTGDVWTWYSGSVGGTKLGTSTTAAFTITPTANSTYFVRAEGCASNASAASVAITVVTSAPSITTQPIQKNIWPTETSASFTVAATGTGTLTYQWKRRLSGGTLSNVSGGTGATSATYTFTPTKASDDQYLYCCQVTNACGTSVTSNEAKLNYIVATGISAGYGFTFFQCTDNGGTSGVWAVGDNSSGQLGDGTGTNRPAPVRVMASSGVPITNVKTIAAGGKFSMFLKNDNTVWTCGDNSVGQLGLGSMAGSSVSYPTKVNCDNLGVIHVAAGYKHCVFQTLDANAATQLIYTCGDNTFGQLGISSTQSMSYTPVTATVSTAYLAGNEQDNISAGDYHTLVYSYNDGKVYGCGRNDKGQLGDGTQTNTNAFKQLISNGTGSVGAGANHTMVFRSGGLVYMCGNNASGQLGNNSGNGYDINFYEIHSNLDPLFGLGITSFAGGSDHSIFWNNGTVLQACGSNAQGQLGNGNTTSSALPITINFTGTIAQIAAKGNSSFILTSDGKIYAYGENINGQLGDGTTTIKTSPTWIKW